MKSCLIIGQGLAGSFIALELLKRNVPCHVYDNGHEQGASQKAAGLWNPVSFKRITAHDSVHQYLQALEDHWKTWTPFLGQDFIHPSSLIRIFPDQSYANDWDVKSDLPKMKPLLGHPIQQLSPWNMPFGAGVVDKAGWLDVPLYLEKVKNYLQSKNSYSQENFDWNLLKTETDHIYYQGREYQQLIFCTGLFHSSPFFEHIPVIPNKGHLIEVHANALPQKNVLHYGHFCIPLGEGKFRIGSSYEWEKSDSAISPTITHELTDHFQKHSNVSPQITKIEVGHRPTVKDRHPIIGRHPHFPRIAIFNGLGTKGVLQGPYLAHLLAEHLLHNAPIPRPFSAARFLNKD